MVRCVAGCGAVWPDGVVRRGRCGVVCGTAFSALYDGLAVVANLIPPSVRNSLRCTSHRRTLCCVAFAFAPVLSAAPLTPTGLYAPRRLESASASPATRPRLRIEHSCARRSTLACTRPSPQRARPAAAAAGTPTRKSAPQRAGAPAMQSID